jgi:hypothetical protein
MPDGPIGLDWNTGTSWHWLNCAVEYPFSFNISARAPWCWASLTWPSGRVESLATRRRSSRELLEPLGEDDAGGGLDERQVGEGLGEVAEVVGGVGVELLGVEAEG